MRADRLYAHLTMRKNMYYRRGEGRRAGDERKSFFLRACFFSLLVLVFHCAFSQGSCGCEEEKLSFTQAYTNAHQLIFRGKTTSIATGEDFSKVTFVITQLFKGSCPKEVDVYYDRKSSCQLKFNTGEDWLIYANFKQVEKPFVEYCSRSRKNIINTNKNVEIQYIKSDLTVDAECEKLSEQFGLQKFSPLVKEGGQQHSNIIPGFWQRIVLILCSVAGFIMIYIGTNKLLKK